MSEQTTHPTRQNLLNIAKQSMMLRGYHATSVEDICKQGGVTKGAFFHYFKTKEALGEAVLRDYWLTRYNQFSASDWMNAPTPLAQVNGFLRVVAGVFMRDPNGFTCLAGSFTQELAATHPNFRALVSELFTEWAGQIQPILAAAKNHAHHPESIDIDLVADHIIVVVEGALLLAIAKDDGAIIARHLAFLEAMLQTVFA